MNPAKQFWTLFKFQLRANPLIWFLVPAACTPVLFITSSDAFLYSVMGNQNLFFVGMLGVMLLAPEMLGSAANNQYPIFASKFVLTRAVDRSVFARAKIAGFYFLILLVPVLILISLLKNPDMKVLPLSKSDNREYLSAFPGSVVVKNTRGIDYIAIPRGKILVASWKIWGCLMMAAVTQLLIVIIYPLSYRKYILWGFLGMAIFLPLLAIYFKLELPIDGQHLLFTFAAHQTLFWIESFCFMMLSQLWCERRFARQEF